MVRNFQLFVLPHLQYNWVDFVIIAVFLFYALEGFSVGFIVAFVDLISFFFSFMLGLRFYSFFGTLLINYTKTPRGFAHAIGFFIAAVMSEMLLSFLLRIILDRMTRHVHNTHGPSGKAALLQTINRVLGIMPGLASAVILLSFLLTMIVALPFSPVLKQAVSSSRLGGGLVAYAQGFEKDLHTVFGGAVNETLNFLTVKPQSNEFVNLNFKTIDVTLDKEAEKQMVVMVNEQRSKRNLPALTVDENLTNLAQVYAKDMLARGYFSHYSPEGTSPFDRMNNAGISYTSAGENLALAPDTDLAMQGLINSAGHRANILSTNYEKVGIGVYDGGIYGKMFVQEFTN